MKSGIILLVIDSSIWIDLVKSDLLDAFFRLPCSFFAADLVSVYESVGVDWDVLVSKGLHLLGLSEEEMGILVSIRQDHQNTSVPDLASFLIAQKTKGVLLTGDRNLLNFAETQVEVHGFLWVMEQLVNENLLTPEGAINCLEQLRQDPNFRLPVDECQKMIRIWRKQS